MRDAGRGRDDRRDGRDRNGSGGGMAEPMRTILVDGFNVLHTVLLKNDRPDGWWKREQRERLLDRVAGWRGGPDEIWVAFDGSRPEESVWEHSPSAREEDQHPSRSDVASPKAQAPTVRSLFAESADDWIVRRARKAEDPTRMIVVSADRQVAGRAKSAGVEVLSPWSFIAECDDLSQPGGGSMIQPEKFSAGMERQLARFEAALANGMPRRGWKVAINVPEFLTALSLPHSGAGWIDGNSVLQSGDSFPAPLGSNLMVEPEVAIFVSENVGPDATLEAARSAIGAVAPALEIVDMASAGDGPPDFDRVVEGSMFHAATVLGEKTPLSKAGELGEAWPRLHAIDSSSAGSASERANTAANPSTQGRIEAEAPRRDLVPDDLAEVVRFVAAYLAAFGASLDAGDLILSGSYTAKALPVTGGQDAVADHGPLGGVRVKITSQTDSRLGAPSGPRDD